MVRPYRAIDSRRVYGVGAAQILGRGDRLGLLGRLGGDVDDPGAAPSFVFSASVRTNGPR
ncbi:hypothetical protein [Streptomyces sp. NBC_01013]|uniref:hypothetical protein n=1 Tax=Streptomyces sp. NBC_01013 TaxID=2903718 RepID=UPI003863A42D|nr:hypothetical protein OG538_35790 [Streptomyces sp. NBC_01013]